MQFSESTLIEGVLFRDERAFEIMYETYFPKVYNYSVLQLRDNKKAEKVTEAIFLEALDSLNHCHGNSSLLKLFFKIARKHIQKEMSQKRMDFSSFCQDGSQPLSDFFKLEETLLNPRNLKVMIGG